MIARIGMLTITLALLAGPAAAGARKNPQRQKAAQAKMFKVYEARTFQGMPYRLMKPIDLTDNPDKAYPLILSLHGAGVHPWGQASSYAPKPDFWVVATTNRRKFGFDWQDWGRRDAYDVLAVALLISGVDRRYVYVTGHSMGGHGT